MTASINEAIYLCLIAFSVVFIVLIILTLLIYAMRGFSKKPTPKPNQTAKPQPTTVISKDRGVTSTKAESNGQIVAVITAAIAASMGGRPFKVASITPQVTQKQQANAWIAAAKLETLHGALTDPWKN